MNTRAEKSFNSAELPGFFLQNFAITESVFLSLLLCGSQGHRYSSLERVYLKESKTKQIVHYGGVPGSVAVE